MLNLLSHPCALTADYLDRETKRSREMKLLPGVLLEIFLDYLANLFGTTRW